MEAMMSPLAMVSDGVGIWPDPERFTWVEYYRMQRSSQLKQEGFNWSDADLESDCAQYFQEVDHFLLKCDSITSFRKNMGEPKAMVLWKMIGELPDGPTKCALQGLAGRDAFNYPRRPRLAVPAPTGFSMENARVYESGKGFGPGIIIPGYNPWKDSSMADFDAAMEALAAFRVHHDAGRNEEAALQEAKFRRFMNWDQ